MSAALQIIQSTQAAEKLLKPDRLRLLEHLAQPDSASGLARRLGMPRQTVNYHLRELEKGGFVEFVEHRTKGNCLERVVRAAARSYLISPRVLGALGMGADAARDRFSAAYLVSAASRAIHDVAVLRARADKASKNIATLTLETEIRFASAKERQAFAEELVQLVAGLTRKYHNTKAEGGRTFRLVAGVYPALAKTNEADDQPAVKLE